MLKRTFGILGSSARATIPRRVTVVLMMSLFLLAFVASPYWRLPSSNLLAFASLLATIGLGAVWSWIAATQIRIEIRAASWVSAGVVLIAMLALNSQALTSVIPWRGDESLHITQTRELISRVPAAYVLLAPVIGLLLGLAAARKSGAILAAGVAVAAYTAIGLLQGDSFHGVNGWLLLRYPYVNYWLYAVAPVLAKYVWDPNHEILYRIAPLIAASALVWAFARRLSGPSPLLGVVWGAAIATIPVVFYYSSILYLELPAAVLMLIVCLHAEDLLGNDPERVRQNAGWWALVLIGFIKETAIVFLLCFLICRAGWTYAGRGTAGGKRVTNIGKRLWDEIIIGFCVLGPCLLYIALRSMLIDTRGFLPDVKNLLDPIMYLTTARSYVEQFALFMPLFLGGLAVLAIRREYRSFSLLVLVALTVPLVFGADRLEYAGYSRFNLLVLPVILAASAVLASQVSRRHKLASAVLGCLAIAVNLAMAPIHLDGTKAPYWGSYLTDTAEHYYPYDDALLWISRNLPQESVLFSGMDYSYYFGFYFAKYNWHPSNETRIIGRGDGEDAALATVLSEAGQEGFGLVLWQLQGSRIPRVDVDADFSLARVFTNEAHVLLLFARHVQTYHPSREALGCLGMTSTCLPLAQAR